MERRVRILSLVPTMEETFAYNRLVSRVSMLGLRLVLRVLYFYR